jgi:hypothetical protein
MKSSLLKTGLCSVLFGLALTGCATRYNYANYREHFPRSILVLPPLNETTDVNATYGYLSTVTMPIAEMGYYVYPVVVVDHFFKENGMPTPGEMHQAAPKKIYEIMGADAVLYITLKQYGSKYLVISSTTCVEAHGKLVDTRTETVLWEGKVMAQQGSNGLLGALVDQIVSQATDAAHQVAIIANRQYAADGTGLLYGPRSPKYRKE